MINRKLDLSDYEAEWKASDGSKWIVHIEFTVYNGRSVASAFAIRPLPGSQELTQSILRELPFRKMAFYTRKRPDLSDRKKQCNADCVYEKSVKTGHVADLPDCRTKKSKRLLIVS